MSTPPITVSPSCRKQRLPPGPACCAQNMVVCLSRTLLQKCKPVHPPIKLLMFLFKKKKKKDQCLLGNCEVLLDQRVWRHDARIFVIFLLCFDLPFLSVSLSFFQYITPQGQGWTKTCLNLDSPEIQRDCNFCQLHGPQIFLALR